MEEVVGRVLEVETSKVGVWALVSPVIRSLRGAPASREERQMRALAEYAASRFGADIVEATSGDDLDRRLAAVICAPEFHRIDMLMRAFLSSSVLVDISRTTEPPKALLDAMGAEQAPMLREGASLLSTWGDALRQLIERHGLEAAGAAPRADPPDLIRGLGASDDIDDALRGSLEAGACMLAMCEVLISGRELKPWLAHAIVQRWLRGLRVHLRLVASLPGIHVPEDVIPPHERIDLTPLLDTRTRRLPVTRGPDGAISLTEFLHVLATVPRPQRSREDIDHELEEERTGWE